MVLSLTLPPCTAMKAMALSSGRSPHRYWHAAVRSSESSLFSRLDKPHFLRPCRGVVLQPSNHPMITGLFMQPSMLGGTADSCLLCCPALQQSFSPACPSPAFVIAGVSSFPGVVLCLNTD